MTTQLTTTQPQIPEEKYELVRSMFAKGCSNNEFLVLVELANKYNLDPFARQIWAVKYGSEPARIFAGRDGYLAVAHRSGQFDGMKAWLNKAADGSIESATCVVYRKDMKEPFEVTALMEEYNTHKGVWADKPGTMLIKVAQSQCLRQAFAITGLYDSTEFDMPYRVEPLPTDIVVTPVDPQPVAEPRAAPVSIPTPTPVPKQEAAKPEKPVKEIPEFLKDRYLENFETQGFDCSIFAAARLENGMYDENMILESFYAQRDAKKKKAAEAEPPKSAAQEETSIQAQTGTAHCDTCGKELSAKELEVTLRAAVNGIFCTSCLCKEIEEKTLGQKCKECGKTVIPLDAVRALKAHGEIICPDCYLARREAEFQKSRRAKE